MNRKNNGQFSKKKDRVKRFKYLMIFVALIGLLVSGDEIGTSMVHASVVPVVNIQKKVNLIQQAKNLEVEKNKVNSEIEQNRQDQINFH